MIYVAYVFRGLELIIAAGAQCSSTVPGTVEYTDRDLFDV